MLKKYIAFFLLILNFTINAVDLRIYNLTTKSVKIRFDNTNFKEAFTCMRTFAEDLNGGETAPIYMLLQVEPDEVMPFEIEIGPKNISCNQVLIQDLKEYEIIQICGWLNWSNIPLEQFCALSRQAGVQEISVSIAANLVGYTFNFFISKVD